jgi:ubiquinone/menaquinone biosynthesis C-methylase UbiE
MIRRNFSREESLQRAYYKRTASRYDGMHVCENDEHYRAMRLMLSFFDELECRSVLDIGSGTGRLLRELKRRLPDIRAIGVEPSPELRAEGHNLGIAFDELIDGDAQALHFDNRSFDIVCEFGSLHHIPQPTLAVKEMLRVARKAIFISDSNNFGQGKAVVRSIKQAINAVGLWPIANWIKNGGQRYILSEGDGLAYSYSVFNDYDEISRHCSEILILNTHGKAINMYREAPHIALLGLIRDVE